MKARRQRAGRIACATFRESISAALDGEETELSETTWREHLRNCVGCRSFAEHNEAVLATLRLRPLVQSPDLSREILHRLGVPSTPYRSRGRRVRLPALGRWAAALVPLAFSGSALGVGAFRLVAAPPAPPATPCTVDLADRGSMARPSTAIIHMPGTAAPSLPRSHGPRAPVSTAGKGGPSPTV